MAHPCSNPRHCQSSGGRDKVQIAQYFYDWGMGHFTVHISGTELTVRYVSEHCLNVQWLTVDCLCQLDWPRQVIQLISAIYSPIYTVDQQTYISCPLSIEKDIQYCCHCMTYAQGHAELEEGPAMQARWDMRATYINTDSGSKMENLEAYLKSQTVKSLTCTNFYVQALYIHDKWEVSSSKLTVEIDLSCTTCIVCMQWQYIYCRLLTVWDVRVGVCT